MLGTGPTVVLLHSGVSDRRMWEHQFAAIADAGYRVVRCDIAGYGETPAPDGPNNDADDVIALLDQLDGGAGTVTFVGSSFGGGLALEIAARRPERVRALALLCAGLAGREPSEALVEFREREEQYLESGDLDSAVEFQVENWLGPDADEDAKDLLYLMLANAYEIQLNAEEYEQTTAEFDLAAIGDTPVLAAWGGWDLPDYRDVAEHLAATLPNARALELSWAGHFPSLERPQETLEIVLGFLKSVHEDERAQ